MERGLYIAAAGMIAEQIRQDQISNDLARLKSLNAEGCSRASRSKSTMFRCDFSRARIRWLR